MRSGESFEDQAIALHDIPPAFWQAVEGGVFSDLAIGDRIELVSHEDPAPIWTLLNALLPDRFTWEYAEQGPREWRVHLRRRPSKAGGRSSRRHAGRSSSRYTIWIESAA